jgi:hypothetical protein
VPDWRFGVEPRPAPEMEDKFPKLIYHSIVCIGALVGQRREEHWEVSAQTSGSAKRSSLPISLWANPQKEVVRLL